MNMKGKQMNLVKHKPTHLNNYKQKRFEISDNENNFSLDLNKPQKKELTEETNYWNPTTINVPENSGNPIYYDNGTVNVGSNEYQSPKMYSEIEVLEKSNTKNFGYSITSSQDGSVIAVCDYNNNTIWIYSIDTSNNEWKITYQIDYSDIKGKTFKLKDKNSQVTLKQTENSKSQFGQSISMAFDGSSLLIGAPGLSVTDSNYFGKGVVFLYVKSNETFQYSNIILPNYSNQTDFGYSVYLYHHDLFWAIGSPNMNGDKSGSIKYYVKKKGGIEENYKGYDKSSGGGYCLDAYVQTQKNDQDQPFVSKYVLAVGSPFSDFVEDDENIAVDTGEISLLTYNFNNETNYESDSLVVTCDKTECGNNYNIGLSLSVTNDGQFILAGAPGYKNVGAAFCFKNSIESPSFISCDYFSYIVNPTTDLSDSSAVGNFGFSVKTFNDQSSENKLARFIISDPSLQNKPSANSVYLYEFSSEEPNSQVNKLNSNELDVKYSLSWSGIPYSDVEYGYGYSLQVTNKNDLMITSPSEINLLENDQVGIVQIYNNRTQLAFFVQGPSIIDGDVYGKTIIKNGLFNYTMGDLPNYNNSLISLSNTAINNNLSFSIDAFNYSEFSTMFSEQKLSVSLNDSNKSSQNLRFGSVYLKNDNYVESYVGFNSVLNFYQYNEQNGFAWVDGYKNPVKLNKGMKDGKFEEIDSSITIENKQDDSGVNFTVNGNVYSDNIKLMQNQIKDLTDKVNNLLPSDPPSN